MWKNLHNGIYVAPRSEFGDVFNKILDGSHSETHSKHNADPMEELEEFLDLEVSYEKQYFINYRYVRFINL